MTLSLRLRQHARFAPTKPAIVERDRSIDYRTLDRMVDFTCARLLDQAIARGMLVGLTMRDGAVYLVVVLALARIGAILLPLDPRWTDAETAHVAHNFGAERILGDSAGTGDDRILLDAGFFGESDTPHDDPQVTLDSPLLLSLSSGTTGMPKGPLVSQGKFIDRFMVYWIDLRLSAHDRFLTATPLYFGGGRGFALAMLYAGGTALLFCPPYAPQDVVEFARRERATAAFLVPTLLNRLLKIDAEPGWLLPDLDVLISSGSALYPAEHRAIRDRVCARLYQYYSSTEGGGCTLLTPEAFDDHPGSVGQPCFGVEVEIVDAAHKPLPPENVGQIRYRSAASADHYYRVDGAAAFRDGFFYPGDLGEFDSDGFLYLRGRAKDMVIRGGVNIYPADVETVLLELAGVSAAAVFGVPSTEFGEDIAAAVVMANFDGDLLARHCAARLASFKVPRYFMDFGELPTKGVGKVDKAALVAQHASETGSCQVSS